MKKAAEARKNDALRSRTEKKHSKNSHLIIHFPAQECASECSGVREQSDQCGASERVSGASD